MSLNSGGIALGNRSALGGFVIGSAVTLSLCWLCFNFYSGTGSSSSSSKGTRAVSADDKSVLVHNDTTNNNDNESNDDAPNDEIRREQLSRHELYFGVKGMKMLEEAKVLVVGLGGVGSHTVHMLARGGIGFLRLIDFDQVTLSSLNRHACATLQDVGIPKATCIKQFCEKLVVGKRQRSKPYLQMEDVVAMYTQETGPELLAGHEWTLVIDAIDDVPTKAALIAQCMKQKIRCISCMGAGGKSDMTRLHISDLKTASRDPLASKLRQQLKRRFSSNNTDLDFMDQVDRLAIVYSSEKPVVKLADFSSDEQRNAPNDFGAVDGMRIRILPVLGTMPAIMGQALAGLALCEIGGMPFSPVPGERVGRNVRNRIFQHFKRRELKIQQQQLKAEEEESTVSSRQVDKQDPERGEKEVRGAKGTVDVGTADAGKRGRILKNGVWVGDLQIDSDDVEYLLEMWCNRCSVTGDRLGTVLELVRWDLTRPSQCDNIVLMSTHARDRFDKEGGIDSISKQIQERIQTRLRDMENRL